MVLEHIRCEAIKGGLSSLAAKRLELACEEVIVNVIEHAYSGREGEIDVEVTSPREKEVHVVVSDDGPPFDPLVARLNPDVDLPLEAREAGGLGLFLVRQIVDQLDYKREGERNVVILIKRSEER